MKTKRPLVIGEKDPTGEPRTNAGAVGLAGICANMVKYYIVTGQRNELGILTRGNCKCQKLYPLHTNVSYDQVSTQRIR